MKRIWHAVLGQSAFWGGALGGILVAVLVLGAAGVGAQMGGDAPSDAGAVGGAPAREAGPTGAAPQAGATMFDAPDAMQLAATAAFEAAMTYQGALQDGAGPANGSFDLRFRLFDDPDAGNQLGEQLADAVAVEDGQFTAPLSFGSDLFASQLVWLEIAVRPAGGGAYETLTPRQAVAAAPLALGLPNVSTDPVTGRVSIGGGAPISSGEVLGVKRSIDGWVGMYITGGGPNARPFYGYATDDEGGYEWAWTEYNGAADEWQLYTMAGNVFAVSNGGDVRAQGDFSQPVTANGLVKAAAYVDCWDIASLLGVPRSFNTVTGAPVTAAVGPGPGQCYIDFGFDLTGRFFSVSAVWSTLPRVANCDVDGSNPNRLRCLRWRPVEAGSEPWGGALMVMVY